LYTVASHVRHVQVMCPPPWPRHAGWPFWRNSELEIRRRDAGMGPLVNDAGMYLTAVISQWRADKEPDPFGDVSHGRPDEECVRGIAEKVDSTGLLWVCEKMIPRSALDAMIPPPKG